jgi:hypothetical protein
MRFVLVFLAIVLTLSCNEPAIQPHDRIEPAVATISRYLRSAAGASAIDCGIAIDEQKRRAVYACAERSFRADRAFLAVFPRQAEIQIAPLLDRSTLGWASPATGLFSIGDGVLHSADIDQAERIRSGIMFNKHRDDRVLRVGGIVKPPELIGSSPTVAGATPKIHGLVIVECHISSTGIVTESTVMKRLPGNSTELAVGLLRNVRFLPGTVFGYPTAVIYNISLQVRDGHVRIVRPGG